MALRLLDIRVGPQGTLPLQRCSISRPLTRSGEATRVQTAVAAEFFLDSTGTKRERPCSCIVDVSNQEEAEGLIRGWYDATVIMGCNLSRVGVWQVYLTHWLQKRANMPTTFWYGTGEQPFSYVDMYGLHHHGDSHDIGVVRQTHASALPSLAVIWICVLFEHFTWG